MGDDCRKIIHANKIRKYITRAMSCGLIVEEDEDFGSVVELLTKNDWQDEKNSLNLDPDQIGHLTLIQPKTIAGSTEQIF